MKRSIFLFLTFLLSVFTVFSQELYEDSSENTNEPEIEEALDEIKTQPVYIISSFDFNISGFTRPDALIYKGEFKTGEKITGLSNLEKYISDKTQILFNERVLDSVSIEYVTGDEEDGLIPVHLKITVKDTWNIVAIPRPRYRSGYGFDLTLKARDYNFLGTMSPLRLDIWYKFDEERRNSFGTELDANIPFWAAGLRWNFKFLNAFDYRPKTEQPFYYKNVTGLSVELPVKTTTITFGFNESFLINEENNDIDKPLYGDFQNGFYMSSKPYASWKIPTGVEVGEFGELTYTPELSFTANHEYKKWQLDEIRKGPFLIFKHKIGFEKIDWIGNFQRGFDVSVDNSFDYNFYMLSRDQKALITSLSFKGTGHFIITDFFGISTRLMYRHWFLRDGEYREAGDILRGVLDKDIHTDYMLSLNLDFPVRVLRFSPSTWFDNKKLRILNFDFHLSPVIDMALYHDPVDNIDFSFKNILASGGIEAIVFPEFFRSLYLRISMGWDLANFSDGRNWELYIGTDFHY